MQDIERSGGGVGNLDFRVSQGTGIHAENQVIQFIKINGRVTRNGSKALGRVEGGKVSGVHFKDAPAVSAEVDSGDHGAFKEEALNHAFKGEITNQHIAGSRHALEVGLGLLNDADADQSALVVAAFVGHIGAKENRGDDTGLKGDFDAEGRNAAHAPRKGVLIAGISQPRLAEVNNQRVSVGTVIGRAVERVKGAQLRNGKAALRAAVDGKVDFLDNRSGIRRTGGRSLKENRMVTTIAREVANSDAAGGDIVEGRGLKQRVGHFVASPGLELGEQAANERDAGELGAHIHLLLKVNAGEDGNGGNNNGLGHIGHRS